MVTHAGAAAAGPAMRSRIDEENPWPGLSAFDEAAERFFNGRGEETAALRRLVAQGPLTVLFGASGLGKTSLLKAGLFPLIRREHALPIYVRLDFRDRGAPLVQQLKLALEAELKAEHVDAPPFGHDESLWQYLHRNDLELWSAQNQLLTPLFVLDQFEEVFTLGATDAAAIAGLRTDLADLIENRVPAVLAQEVLNSERATARLSLDRQRYKVLLSFREDFLPAVEGWKHAMPSIVRNRLRMLPMSGDQAFEAVHKTAPHLASADISRRIVAFVAASGEQEHPESMSELPVEPALLSLVCRGLNERRREQGKPAFDDALLQGTGQAIIEDFYLSAISGLPDHLQRFIASELITEAGYRKPCDLDDARRVHNVTDEQLRILEDRRVIRREWARGSERVELTHDLLTPVVREHRARQRLEDRMRRDRQARQRFMTIGAALWIIAVTMAWLYYRANQQKGVAEAERARAEAALTDARDQKTLADTAKDEAERQRQQAVDMQRRAERASAEAFTAKTNAETEARAAFSHQLAGAAINAARESADAAILLALSAIAATRETDDLVLPEAVDALRRVSPPPARLMPLPGHTAAVKRIAFSPDGRRLATASDGIRIWDLAAQDQQLRIDGASCAIMNFSRNGRRLSCANPSYGDSHVFDTETGTVVQSVSNTEATGSRSRIITRLLLSPDGNRLVAGDAEQIGIFENGVAKASIPGGRAAFSDDGRLLAMVVRPDQKAERWIVRISDAGSGRELRTLESSEYVENAAFSSNAELLATSGSSTNVWNLSSGTKVRISDLSSSECMVFSPDGARLMILSGGRFGSADTKTGQLVSAFSLPYPYRADGSDCHLSPDGRMFVLAGFDRKTRDMVDFPMVLDVSSSPVRIHRYWDFKGVFNPTGSVLAIPSDKSVVVRDYATETELELPPQTARIDVAAFSPDPSRIVTGGSDRRARIWRVTDSRRLYTLVGHKRPITAVAYSPDGSLIATAAGDEIAKLWDARTGRFLRDLTGHRAQILDIAFSADSRRVATAANDLTVHIWDAAGGSALTADAPLRRSSPAFCLAFSANGKYLAIAGQQVAIVDSVSFKSIGNVPPLPTLPVGLAAAPDGTMLAAVLNDGVHVWRRGSNWELLQRTVGGIAPALVRIAFSRDGSRLLTPGTDNTIRIWDTVSWSEMTTLYYSPRGGERVSIKALAFGPDEKRVYAVTDDVGVYEFPLALDAVIREATTRVKHASLSDADCVKYLHQQSCPGQLRRRP